MKYNHHPDPAIGFCIEIDEIKAMAYNRRIGLDPEPTLENRIERAMGFRVGGD
jgi:predicted pyridoxine 5'-phosphate oxidase superfamily flavin-nucleotide-binding protein